MPIRCCGSRPGRRFDYETQAFVAISGTVDAVRPDADPLVSAVTSPAEIAAYAADVESLAPRVNLPPLAFDRTRAYRLDRYAAAVVIRDRRSAAVRPGPVGSELQSPLLTDIVVVRTRGDDNEREVYPLFVPGLDGAGFGWGPIDHFIDAFELEDGTAYLAFERRDYEAIGLRLFALTEDGGPSTAVEVGLYGC